MDEEFIAAILLFLNERGLSSSIATPLMCTPSRHLFRGGHSVDYIEHANGKFMFWVSVNGSMAQVDVMLVNPVVAADGLMGNEHWHLTRDFDLSHPASLDRIGELLEKWNESWSGVVK